MDGHTDGTYMHPIHLITFHRKLFQGDKHKIIKMSKILKINFQLQHLNQQFITLIIRQL